MPGESAFSQRVTLTRTRNVVNRRRPPRWLLQWPRPTLTPSSPPLTVSPQTGESNKCFPSPKTPSVRCAGSSATSPTAVPAHCPFIHTARSPIPRWSIAALTVPALRVAISDLSSPAVHPRWHAALTAKKSTLRAAGIAIPVRRPLQRPHKCDLDRCWTAWISLKTRLALRRSFVQHQVPLLTPLVILYSPAMLLHPDKEPTAPSPLPISPQERAVMNLWTPTPPRALPISGELLQSFTMLPHPPLLVGIQDPPSRGSVLPIFPGFRSFAPPPSWPPTGSHLCFSYLKPALVLLVRVL